jgi:hypothetical protein
MLPFELEAPGEAFAGAMATCPWWERRKPTSSTREGSDAMAREVLGSFGRLGHDAQPTSVNINQQKQLGTLGGLTWFDAAGENTSDTKRP